MSVVFDELSFVRRLEGEGTFTRPQAETLSDAFHKALVAAGVRTSIADSRVWMVSVGASIVAVLSAIKYSG